MKRKRIKTSKHYMLRDDKKPNPYTNFLGPWALRVHKISLTLGHAKSLKEHQKLVSCVSYCDSSNRANVGYESQLWQPRKRNSVLDCGKTIKLSIVAKRNMDKIKMIIIVSWLNTIFFLQHFVNNEKNNNLVKRSILLCFNWF